MVVAGDVRVTAPRRTGGRVTADVDGSPVWFESDDVELAPSAEAFGSAFLLAAADQGRRLCIEAPVSRAWRKGAGVVLDVAGRWWGPSPTEPLAPVPTTSGLRRRRLDRPRLDRPRLDRPRGVALCFSAGADSFHALLRGSPRPDVLVTALGYDVPLADAPRCASMEEDVRAVAAATGTTAVVVRTNLREHPLHRTSRWDRTHGGALAALGHLLSGRVATLLLAASYPVEHLQPWGSHPDLDRHWSADVEVRHVGADRWRAQKLAELAGERLVADHLRVCWQHGTRDVNCGSCEKCVRTACDLLAAGGLDRFERLPSEDELPARLAALESAGGSAVVFERLLDGPGSDRLPPAVRTQIERLLVRTRSSAP